MNDFFIVRAISDFQQSFVIVTLIDCVLQCQCMECDCLIFTIFCQQVQQSSVVKYCRPRTLFCFFETTELFELY